MNYRSVISFAAIFFCFFISIVGGPGCANIVPPLGGPKDTLPPNIVRLSPKDCTRNFTGDKITIVFDEYIDLDNVQQNLIVSPVPKVNPSVNRKLNELTIKIRDTLEPRTTYSYNFGNAIKDINEGNPLKNYTYIFSTGPQIDSLQFTGKVMLAESGDYDTTLTVMLHRSGDDSAVVKEKPRYIAKLDGQGNFHFKNLAPGTYYVYALQDETNSYRYMGTDKLFAFADSAVVVNGNTKSINLYAYAVAKPPSPPSSANTNAGRGRVVDKRLKYTTTIRDNFHSLLEPFRFQFETPIKTFDSTRISITMDSTFTPVTNYSWKLDTLRKTLTLNYTWAQDKLYHIIMQKDFATDTLNQQLLKGDTLDFTTRNHTDYGAFQLRFRNLDLTGNPVLQVVQNNEVIESYPLTSNILKQPLFIPGEYSLRILHDVNKNGKWDAGEFFGKHKQPELVTPLQRRINIRQNIDNEYELDVTPNSNSGAIPPSSGYPMPPVRNTPRAGNR